MLAPCRCGAAPTAFQSERTGQYVVCCRADDCDFTAVVAEDSPRAAVERWAAVVSRVRVRRVPPGPAVLIPSGVVAEHSGYMVVDVEVKP